MFKYRALILTAASALALVGCTNNEIDDNVNNGDGRTPITFSTYVPQSTRLIFAQTTDIWTLVNNDFSLTAINDRTDAPYIENVAFKVDDPDDGTCLPVSGTSYYWPGDTAVTFYAVYPQSGEDLDSSPICWLDAANNQVVYSPNGSNDIVAAYATGNAKSNEGNVRLNFKHLAAKVILAATCDNADYNYKLQDVKLTVPTRSSYRFSTRKIEVVSGVDSTTLESVEMAYPNMAVSVDETVAGFDTLMVAADGTNGSTCRLDVTYQTTINGSARTYTKSALVPVIAGYENSIVISLAGDTPLSISVQANGWTADNEIDANGHEYIDMGLPSGTLWATCNIGATTPEGYGNYYAWGETDTKDTYTWETYAFGTESHLTKYCNDASCGNVDNLLTLEAEDDAAAVVWQGDWRIPTHEAFSELFENCNRELTTQNEVPGYMFTSKINGNTLFFPVDSYLSAPGEIYGVYWTSSLNTTDPNGAWYMFIAIYDNNNSNSNCTLSDYYNTDYNSRMYMQAIRPVIPREAIQF